MTDIRERLARVLYDLSPVKITHEYGHEVEPVVIRKWESLSNAYRESLRRDADVILAEFTVIEKDAGQIMAEADAEQDERDRMFDD